MLEMNVDKVCFVALKARGLVVQEGVVEPDPASHPSDDGAAAVLAAHPEDPTAQELSAFVDALDVDERTELVALTWLGRGDFSVEEWPQAVAQARERDNGRTADYLLGLPLLADYLEEGLARFDLSCADFAAERR